MALFTVENAAEFARRSHLPGSARFRKPEPAAPEPQPVPKPAEEPTKSAAIVRVIKQLEMVDAMLDECHDAKAWDQLTRSKERLAKVWFHLGGIAGPGNRRPGPEHTARAGVSQIPRLIDLPRPAPAPTITSGPAPTSAAPEVIPEAESP